MTSQHPAEQQVPLQLDRVQARQHTHTHAHAPIWTQARSSSSSSSSTCLSMVAASVARAQKRKSKKTMFPRPEQNRTSRGNTGASAVFIPFNFARRGGGGCSEPMIGQNVGTFRQDFFYFFLGGGVIKQHQRLKDGR